MLEDKVGARPGAADPLHLPHVAQNRRREETVEVFSAYHGFRQPLTEGRVRTAPDLSRAFVDAAQLCDELGAAG